MPMPPTPPEAPPPIRAGDVLGIVLHCQNKACRRRGWVEPAAVDGRTLPGVERKAKCQGCGQRGASAEVFLASSDHSGFRPASDAEFAERWRSWFRAHPYP